MILVEGVLGNHVEGAYSKALLHGAVDARDGVAAGLEV